jgi:GrpB-like predicted nucleotidyltransferase (UPF0157 family)
MPSRRSSDLGQELAIASLGLERGRVTIVSYDIRWAELFQSIAVQLRQTLGGLALAIEHVGSTAVPGLVAKPILDVLVGIADFKDGYAMVPALAKLEFEYRPDEEIPDRHFFRRLAGGVRTHHLSLADPGSSHYRRTVGFRDALREDVALRAAYGELKAKLAGDYPTDRERYLAGKTDFVLSVLSARGLLG